jgi:hypothetical protein
METLLLIHLVSIVISLTLFVLIELKIREIDVSLSAFIALILLSVLPLLNAVYVVWSLITALRFHSEHPIIVFKAKK